MIIIIYMILGYWATGKTIYADKIIFYKEFGDLFLRRLIYGILLGWMLIPYALVKCIFRK